MASSQQKYPSSASSGVSNGNNLPWSNPTNIEVDDGTFATNVLSIPQFSDSLVANNFGFTIPSTAIIEGIVVETNRKHQNGTTNGHAKLQKTGTLVGNQKDEADSWTTSLVLEALGANNDLWGTTWLYSDINDVNFGVQYFADHSATNGCTLSVDSIRITVYYNTPGASPSASLSPSASRSPSVSLSPSASRSPSSSLSASLSPSASRSPSASLSPSTSVSASISPSVSTSPSASPSASSLEFTLSETKHATSPSYETKNNTTFTLESKHSNSWINEQRN